MDTIVITGANRGLGQATARYLLQRGHAVVFEDFSPQPFWTTIETNVLGIFRVLKAFVSLLANSRNPRVVDISSGYGIESFWSILKRGEMFHPLSATHLQRYVNEFSSRQTIRALQQMSLIAKGFIGKRWALVR